MLKDEVGKLAPERLLNAPAEDLSRYFVDKYSFDVPVLTEEGIEAMPLRVRTCICTTSRLTIQKRLVALCLAPGIWLIQRRETWALQSDLQIAFLNLTNLNH